MIFLTGPGNSPPARPLLLAHFMPWFETKAMSGTWGFHWSMNRVDPSSGSIASHFHPAIGPYDSGDPKVLEYQFLLMKLSGIDGVLIDWYGVSQVNDYPKLQLNTLKAIDAATKAGLKFGLVYEDHTVEETLSKRPGSTGVGVGRESVAWAANHWFRLPNYLKVDGRPLFLVFGPSFLRDPDWKAVFAGVSPSPSFYTLRNRISVADGCFAWPFPQLGLKGSWSNLASFYRGPGPKIASIYARFEDDYGTSLGVIPDDAGATLRKTMEMALGSHSPFVQIATWNDWGEGTQIEPSLEFGVRDLAYIQRVRRGVDPFFKFSEGDLGLPLKLYRLRVGGGKGADRASAALFAGKVGDAKRILGR